MKKVKFKKLIALVIGATMLGPTSGVRAEEGFELVKKYVALGDSISYGMSAEKGKGYVDSVYNNLKLFDENMNLINLSVPGATSSDLVKTIEMKAQDIENADIVTISIGGNNFLKPTIKAISNALGIDEETIDLAKEITIKVAVNPKEAKNRLESLKDNKEYINELTQGANQLIKDFPKVIELVKKAAPKAKIYVNNLYNPFSKTSPFYSVYDNICIEMNRQLMGLTSERAESQCNIIDVYSLFKDRSDYVNFDVATVKIDPHPSAEGHYAIAKKLVNTIINGDLEPDNTDGEIYKRAYEATMKAVESKEQKDINEARKLILTMPPQLEWAKSPLSSKLDEVQNQLINNFIVAGQKYMKTKNDEDYAKAKELYESLVTVEYNDWVKNWVTGLIKQYME